MKLSVFVLTVVFAVGLAGCQSGGDAGKADEKAPDCDKVCQHAFNLELAAASDEEKKDYEQEKEEYITDCTEACKEKMDDIAKKCVVVAKAAADLKTCKKEARKRAKAAKGEKKSEEKPAEK